MKAQRAFLRPKIHLLLWLTLALLMLMIGSIAVGSFEMSLVKIVRTLLGLEQASCRIVVWDIRMPRIVAAVMTGCGLGLAGVAVQSLLRNPLASPFTLGISQWAAFGDVARSSWQEIGLLALVTAAVLLYFVYNRWNLNALSAGDDAARGLGVDIHRLRLVGMFLAALVAALATAFHGVIAFLGLLAPHIACRLAGGDHGLLVPYTCVVGSLLLLAADTLGRMLVGSGTLPVGVLTSFMGAPLFLFLLMKGFNR